ncbi:hypothetical protein BDZ45DRAFT_93753 [Acephala macrosclerotiorum]|nr:hypothetical protein BDZ45DRAFT_93753 [Acephala macrosclerotiorum]
MYVVRIPFLSARMSLVDVKLSSFAMFVCGYFCMYQHVQDKARCMAAGFLLAVKRCAAEWRMRCQEREGEPVQLLVFPLTCLSTWSSVKGTS